MHLPFVASLIFCLLLAIALDASPLHVRDIAAEFPDPIDDPFYAPPSNLDSFKAGQIIRSRAVNTTITSKDLDSSFQVLYRTTDTQNNSEATVATLWSPVKPKIPQQILSYHTYMDSNSFDCAPSWAFVKGSKSLGFGPILTDAPIFITWALGKGIYVVDPDDEGPKGAFIAGFQEGQASLDGIRATKNFFKLPMNTGAALVGYSGGGSVTAWAANLAGSYAPDLNIIGATHGGTPIDTRRLFKYLNGGLFSGFLGAGLVGLMQAYPELNQYILAHIDSKGLEIVNQYRGRNNCIQNVIFAHPMTDFFTFFNKSNPLDDPIPKAVLARETLLMDVSSVGVNVPRFPRMIWHAFLDQIIPFSDVKEFVDQQCAHGADIQFQVMPIAEHMSAEFGGIAGAINFLDQLFKGSVPKVKCGTAPSIFPNLFAPQAMEILGNDTVTSLKKLDGTKVNGMNVSLMPANHQRRGKRRSMHFK